MSSLGEPVQAGFLEVDPKIVESIELAAEGHFFVKTKKLVPAIDDIIGTSLNDVWTKIAERVRFGNVCYTKSITTVR